MKNLSMDSLKTIYEEARCNRDGFNTQCFAEDTKLTTKSGPKMIKSLDLGRDRIWNPVNLRWMKAVKKRIRTHKGLALTIRTSRGVVTVTDSHIFMLQNGGPIIANELKIGDLLADGRSGDTIKDIAIFKVKDYMVVYNLVFENQDNITKDAPENYFVEANGVVSGIPSLKANLVFENQVLENRA